MPPRSPLILLLFSPLLLPGQALNMSRDLVANGIAISNLAPDSPALDARPLFEAAVSYAVQNGIPTLTADPGAYYFLTLHNSSTHVLLNSATNLTIDWQNSNLLFHSSNVSAIQCSNCSGVVMENFTLDYQQLPFTQITVTSVNAGAQTFNFTTIPGYQSPSDFNTNRAPDGSDAIWMFVFRNGTPIREVGRLGAKRPVSGNTIGISDVNDPWARPAQLAAIQPGDTVVFTDRGGPPAINFVNGQNDAVRNASIYSSGQIGLYFGRTNGAIADHVQVIPKPGDTRLISTNADGIHTSFALGANVFTDNTVRRTCDDALAISAPWIATVTTANGAGVSVARNFASPFPPGSSVSFIDPVTDAVAGTATIVSESPAYNQQKFTDGEAVTLTLDRSVSGLLANFGMADNDAAKQGSGSEIGYNTVEEGVFARGVWLAGVQNVSVHDNYIRNTSSNGIFIQQLSGNNTDAGPSSNIQIRNNLVDNALAYANVSHGVTFAAASIYAVSQNSSNAQVASAPHRNISVTGNRVTNSARSAIRLENVNTGEISGNAIQGFGLAPTTNVFTAPACCETLAQYEADFQRDILTPSSTGVLVSGNSSDDGRLVAATVSTASGYPRVGVGSFAAAYGLNLAASTVVAAQAPLPLTLGGVTVTVQDSAGISRSAAIQAVSANQVNYLIPDGTAPGIATVTIGSASGAAQIDNVGPGLYSKSADGKGVAAANAAIYAADGSVVPQAVFQCAAGSPCVSSPMDLGNPGDQLIVSLYGTGIRNNSGLQNATAMVGGSRATLLYAGAQPQYPGLDQVNLVIPRSLAGAGEVPIVLTVDGQTANVVTINVK
jgi:uncharacterized protein (TIGR03437 family)